MWFLYILSFSSFAKNRIEKRNLIEKINKCFHLLKKLSNLFQEDKTNKPNWLGTEQEGNECFNGFIWRTWVTWAGFSGENRNASRSNEALSQTFCRNQRSSRLVTSIKSFPKLPETFQLFCFHPGYVIIHRFCINFLFVVLVSRFNHFNENSDNLHSKSVLFQH